MAFNPNQAGVTLMTPARKVLGSADSLKSDSTDLTIGGATVVAKAVRVNVAGDLVIDTIGGSTNQTIPALAGETIVAQITRIRSTNCTASGLTLYYD